MNSATGRFWAKVRKTSGCWLWTAACTKKGYGVFYFNGRQGYAHRFSYEMHTGKSPGSSFVLHRCDNPRCVRAAHLWLGSPQANTDDMMTKGRESRGVTRYNAKLTPEDVRKIRKALFSGVKNGCLASQYGVSPSTIYKIRVGETWRRTILEPSQILSSTSVTGAVCPST